MSREWDRALCDVDRGQWLRPLLCSPPTGGDKNRRAAMSLRIMYNGQLAR